MKKVNTKIQKRVAKPEEILAWLIERGYVVQMDGKHFVTISGLRFIAKRPPHAVTRFIRMVTLVPSAEQVSPSAPSGANLGGEAASNPASPPQLED